MARIIYAVAGEGFGHSSRSHLIGQRLIDAGHDVMFVGSKKSLVYLTQYFGERVREIFGLSFAYEDGYVDPMETLKRNLIKLPEANEQNAHLFRNYFEPFEPELVISDFEPFSAWWALRNKVPFISIDHEHMLTLCKLEHPSRNWFSRMTASVVTECYYVGAVAYIIINFFNTALKIDAAVSAPPIVRPVVTAIKQGEIGSSSRTKKPTSDNEHILLYSTTGKNAENLLQILQKFSNQKFCVYGFDKEQNFGNCAFRKRSTQGFLTDLAQSKGVIASAGFSLISECMYLKKKMLLLPVAGQYEQIINAHYVEKLGLGISAKRLDETALARFLDEINKPMPSDERILWPDNDEFFRILQDTFDRLPNPISIELP